MALSPALHFLHIASVVIWVGGMFFAYQCLRPAAVEVLEPPQRLSLWAAVFARFFPWVWLALGLILLSGFAMLLAISFAAAPLYLHLMMTLGLVMMAVFGHVFFAPYPKLKREVAAANWPAAGVALNQIRFLVGLNLSLGLLTIAVATLGSLHF